MNIGLFSDTHGLLRPEAVAALEGCDVLIHAGDVGDRETLEELHAMGCRHVVRGNVDHGAWASGADGLPLRLELELGALRVVVVHDRAELEPPDELAARGVGLAVFGHSHRPAVERHADLWLVNPATGGRSRGPRGGGWARRGGAARVASVSR